MYGPSSYTESAILGGECNLSLVWLGRVLFQFSLGVHPLEDAESELAPYLGKRVSLSQYPD